MCPSYFRSITYSTRGSVFHIRVLKKKMSNFDSDMEGVFFFLLSSSIVLLSSNIKLHKMLELGFFPSVR